MVNKLWENLIDSFNSVIPIGGMVLLTGFLIKVPYNTIFSFAVSVFLLIIGITLFTIGADLSMILLGEKIGKTVIKRRKMWLVLLISFILGTIITIAEPDLMVLAKQLTSIPNVLIILAVSIGVGLFLLIGVNRIVKKKEYRNIIIITVMLILGLLTVTAPNFIPLAFDSGGVTTGAMGVPLIVSFGYGISKIRSNSSSDDSFGLCGISSLGPIIIILIIGLFFVTDSTFDISTFTSESNLLLDIYNTFKDSVKDVIISCAPILLLFGLFQLLTGKLNKHEIKKFLIGLLITGAGLVFFLWGASLGFLKMGYYIGNIITNSNYRYLLIPLGMLFGYVIVNAEPAVKILNSQICELTNGSISSKVINLCISVGVCIAVGLGLSRLFFNVSIIYILVPGYILAAILSFKSPSIFTAIAFDSGGVASGPLTTSFLLPICIGACVCLNGNILVDAFGMGALVAMTPLITIQFLGMLYQNKQDKLYLDKEYSEEIIEYNWEV